MDSNIKRKAKSNLKGKEVQTGVKISSDWDFIKFLAPQKNTEKCLLNNRIFFKEMLSVSLPPKANRPGKPVDVCKIV